MATKLYVKSASGTVAIPDLGISVGDSSWTLLAASSPADAEGNSGQFTAREIRDSGDLYDLIIAETLLWSKDGSVTEAAADYVADFMLTQDFTDDLFDLTDGRFVFPNGSSVPASGLEGETFWDNDDDSLMVWDGVQWITVQLGTTDHGSLDGLGDDDHSIYLLLDGDLARNAVTGGVDFSSASGLILPTGTDQTGLSATEGNIMWDTDDDTLYLYDGSQWVNVGAAIASGVLDHGILTGLDDDDHPQYHDGSLAYTGNLDMGGNAITNVGNVDGVDISAFYSSYLAHGPHYTDHDQLAGLGDDDHSQYLLLSGDAARNAVTGAIDMSGGDELRIPQAASIETTLVGHEGAIAWDTDDEIFYVHDGTNWVGIAPASGIVTEHGLLTGLTDDDHPQYTAWEQDETVSGVWTFATDTNEPAFVITPDTSAPSTKLADGAIAIIDGLLSVYDNGRSKWLSVDRASFGAGRRGAATNIYLRTAGDDVPSNVSSYAMPRNGTIVAMSASTESASSWTFEIHINGSSVATLSCTGTSTVATDKNVDFNAGDVLEFYCNGTAVPWPVANVEVAWREAT